MNYHFSFVAALTLSLFSQLYTYRWHGCTMSSVRLQTATVYNISVLQLTYLTVLAKVRPAPKLMGSSLAHATLFHKVS